MHLNGRVARQADDQIPDIVIRRLPIYVRTLERMREHGVATVSSDDLAQDIGVTAAQIRRDLSYFGRFGKQGKGYDVATLVEEILHILHLDLRWDVALIGYGHLGQAIASYRGFGPSSFRIAAVFDSSPQRIGTLTDEGLTVLAHDEIASVVREMQIRMGIVAVPAEAAQDVTNALINGGVTAILNYAPVSLRAPEGIWIREIDPTGAMQSMTYYLTPPDGDDDADRVSDVTANDAHVVNGTLLH